MGRSLRTFVAFVMVAVVMTACSSGSPHASRTTSPSPSASGTASPAPTESAVSAEHNPPGDIPDTQVFVEYSATAGGFHFKFPEGWSRRTTASSVTFADKLNSVQATWTPASAAPTVDTARSQDVPALQRSERAFDLRSVTAVTLPAGQAVLITYRVNSDPNSVTGRQYRLDVLRYELFRSGVKVALILSSPVGADNVDPWRIVSRSFAWI